MSEPGYEAALRAAEASLRRTRKQRQDGTLRLGIDLGTAYVVALVTNQEGEPVATELRESSVVRDGVVLDYHGAIEVVKELLRALERRCGRGFRHAAAGYPPQVNPAEVRAVANVVEAAGPVVTELVDEPTAANAVLGVRDGAVVDVGGGTTGVAVLQRGKVVYTADEPTGGTHFSLVIAGARNLTFEEAERWKVRPANAPAVLELVTPTILKVASIVSRHIARFKVPAVHVVGGTACLPGMGPVMEEALRIPVVVPARPLLVTPLGIARHAPAE